MEHRLWGDAVLGYHLLNVALHSVAAYLVVDTLRRIKEHPNLGVTGALQASQLSLLAGAGKEFPPEIAHPFFWAPFAVIGEGGEEPVSAQIASSGRKAGL